MANVKITTGQYVTIEQKVASVSDRVYAQMLDCLFMWVYLLIVTLIMSFVMSFGYSRNAFTLYIVLLILIAFYHPFFEYFFNGASPGKKILKLKVVHKDGSSPTLGSYLMRWIMFLVECMMLPGIGLICILFNKNCQRLGDMMAGTVVIKTNSHNIYSIDLEHFGFVNNNYVPCYQESAKLSLRQVDVIRNTLMLNNSNRAYYINELSKKVMSFLNIPPLINNNNEMLLRTVLNDYSYYSSRIEI
ncbi:MAG: RDD family protein [Muribaculaceae bacterium]|nr:RDD family protein [Muribaculaceae bacterium]